MKVSASELNGNFGESFRSNELPALAATRRPVAAVYAMTNAVRERRRAEFIARPLLNARFVDYRLSLAA